jgi:hypothetical protein
MQSNNVVFIPSGGGNVLLNIKPNSGNGTVTFGGQ